jgi:hypothetical protein
MRHYSEAAVERAMKVQEVILRDAAKRTPGSRPPRFWAAAPATCAAGRRSTSASASTPSSTAAAEGTAFVPCTGTDLDRGFSLQHERVVARENTVGFARLTLQIERQQWRSTLVGCRVAVYEHLDGTLSLGYGTHEVGGYDPEGVPLGAPGAKAGVKKSVRRRAA